MLSTPLHDALALMPGQVVPNQKHSDRREKAIQLLGCRIDIPIRPSPTNGNDLGSRRALLQDGRQFPLQPGMQNGVGALFHRLRTDFSSGWSKQGQQFGRPTTHILMRATCRLSLGLEGRSRLRDTLIGASLILAPEGQAESLSCGIGTLNYRFFSCVYGSYRSSTPSLVLWRGKPVLHHVRFFCQV
jgi:hypothetical protein